LLEERFEQWKGENPQTDDVMVCGVKLGEWEIMNINKKAPTRQGIKPSEHGL
jgi:hypothetical protein